MPVTLLTNIGEQRIAQAAGTGNSVSVTHIALGDGNGSAYNPTHGQTALRRERARRPIDSQHLIGGNAWRVRTEFPPDTPTFWVREMGFIDSQGNLIAIWAGNDVTPRQTGAISYLIEHILSLTRIAEGLVIVSAPDDATFELALTTGIAIANLQLEQLRQADAIRAAQGNI